jgi:hypothetical protein
MALAVQLYPFLTSELILEFVFCHATASLFPGKQSRDTNRVGGWMSHRSDLESVGGIPLPVPGMEPRVLGSPPVAYALYGLCYPGS